MSLRGWSKDRSSRKSNPPGPSYMSNDQFANYLADLRNNRIARPTGARPAPTPKTLNRRETIDFSPPKPSIAPADHAGSDQHPRSESAASHQRVQSALSNYSSTSRRGRALVKQPYPGVEARNFSPEAASRVLKPSEVVASSVYIERGQRWMEKEEAAALRDAMEDMALTKEQRAEAKLYAAAQKEASELVFQHQYPEVKPRPDAPYRYKEHLRKNSYQHARTHSVNSRYSASVLPQGHRDGSRSVSGGTTSSDESGYKGHIAGSSAAVLLEDHKSSDESRTSSEVTHSHKSRKPYKGLSNSEPSSRSRSTGKRNISGEPAGTFSPEQIFEEAEVEARLDSPPELTDMPAPLKLKARNPLNRVQFVEEPPRSQSTPPELTKKFSRYEIHQNPPSQSRNPAYTANPVAKPIEIKVDTPTKDGIEIRGDDIRQATSRSLKDRSAKLPMPVVVSNRPGRAIVSFDTNWKPKIQADTKPAEESRRPGIEHNFGPTTESKSLPCLPTQKAFQKAPNPTIQCPEAPSIQVTSTPAVSVPEISCTSPSIPSISFPDAPAVTISSPTNALIAAPTMSVSAPPAQQPSARPLPDPKTMSKRPLPRHVASAPVPVPRGHWSPTPGSRATATCHQCQLPIEGRVVSVRGLPERFHPQCLICFTCGTGLEALEISPEPAESRSARISRIRAREIGEHVEEIEGMTEAEDGDERFRFYCHLDWHELYAPRCKHCKTPILGEHAVALGEHWHYGHFFCAECGDPFERGMTHIEVDGYAWCLRCQTKRTERRAPKCKGCRKGVVGNYVEALGGEWHEECFKCIDCGGAFADGQIFAREEYGTTVAACVKCMQRKWKA